VAGELPKGFVAAKQGRSLDPEQVKEWVAERVAPHKRLRGGVVVMESIPKTASGKLLRRLLIDAPPATPASA
jgi:4-coumarate--CoA ligase